MKTVIQTLVMLLILGITPMVSHAQLVIEQAWSAVDLQTPKNNRESLRTLAEIPALDSQGNLIVLGKFVERMDFDGDGVHELEFDESSSFNYYLASIKAGGQLNWAHQFGSEAVEIYSIMDMGYSVITDPDDNIFLTGLTAGTTDFDGDGLDDILAQGTLFQFLAKYTSDGQLSWATPLQGTLLSRTRLVYDTHNNGLFLAGNPKYDCSNPEDFATCTVSENQELTIQYYDTEGQLIWENVSPEISEDSAGNIELVDASVSHNGELYISAKFMGTIDLYSTEGLASLVAPFNADSSRSEGAFWARYDETGNPSIAYSLCSEICFRNKIPLSLDSEGSLYVGGGEFSLVLNADSTTYGHLAKFNHDNELIWLKKRSSDWFLGSLIFHTTLEIDVQDNLYSTGIFTGGVDFDDDGVLDAVSQIKPAVYAVQYDREGILQWMHIPVQEEKPWGFVHGSWIRPFQNDKLYYGGYFNDGELDPDGEGPLLPLPLINGNNSHELFFFYFSSPIVESIGETIEHSHFSITAPAPNPFRDQATFTILLDNREEVQISLYDLLGRQVQSIFSGTLQANTAHQFVIDGSGLPSGTYFYRVTGARFVASKHVVLLK